MNIADPGEVTACGTSARVAAADRGWQRASGRGWLSPAPGGCPELPRQACRRSRSRLVGPSLLRIQTTSPAVSHIPCGGVRVRQLSEDLVAFHGRCPCAGCEPDHHVLAPGRHRFHPRGRVTGPAGRDAARGGGLTSMPGLSTGRWQSRRCGRDLSRRGSQWPEVARKSESKASAGTSSRVCWPRVLVVTLCDRHEAWSR